MTAAGSDFLAERSEAIAQNEVRSRLELGDRLKILNNGCLLLEHVAVQGTLRVNSGNASPVEKALAYLSFLLAWRAGTTSSLILQGFPTDAAGLLRSMLEASALQELFVIDASWAHRWLAGEQVPEAKAFRIIEKDVKLGHTWSELSRVLHPNLAAIENQTRPRESRRDAITIGITGSHRPEQMLRLTANFGVTVNREVMLAERHMAFAPTPRDRDLRNQLVLLTEGLAAELLTRTPDSPRSK